MCDVQNKASDFFGPWILGLIRSYPLRSCWIGSVVAVSYAWSLFVLCLTIYFLTQIPQKALNSIPESVVQEAGPAQSE